MSIKVKESFAQKATRVLKEAHIPSNVIEAIISIGKNTVVNMVFNNVDALRNIPGIGEKRAEIISAALKKVITNSRLSTKAEKREKSVGFSLKSFDKDELWRDVLPLINTIKEFHVKFGEEADPQQLKLAKERKAQLDAILFANPLTVRYKAGRMIRLNRNAISEVALIDYESKKPTKRMTVVEHGVQELFSFDYHLFGNNLKEALEALVEYQKRIQKMLVNNGIKVIGIPADNGTSNMLYGIVASSSSHQKQEKVLLVDTPTLKANKEFFWFGHNIDGFVSITKMTGAELWKARANLIRPWMKPFTDSEGDVIKMKDILFVEDVEKVYAIKNGRRIGSLDGKKIEDGEFNESRVLGDGGVMSLVPLTFQGQCSGVGLKGYLFDGSSAIMATCKKHGIDVEDFMNIEVEGIDGNLHRIGDYKAIAGKGCWKFDKAFKTFDEYSEWLEKQAADRPGLDNIYLLRQSEEIEDEEKVRRLTKSLIQQWLYMSAAEIREITKKARTDLRNAKSFTGSVRKLAALYKNADERSAVERLFYYCPWLVMNPVIQEYLKTSWERKVVEAASCKFRTNGQYPYIMQDPVALLEVWVLKMDPNDPDLGILRGDEVSCADVPDGKELLCVRFPANFLTAMVMKNKACVEEFESMNGVLVLSVHSLILITQDGDVDGDEMCVIYDKLAIELTKRMHKEFNPPVVLFQHGGKPERHNYNNREEFLDNCADALWRAKRYDSVGIYANMAMKTAYLAAVAKARGDKTNMDKYLVWMSAASTGAIMAIDQVKGNDVDEGLIKWLNDISNWIRKEFKAIAAEMGFSKLEQSLRQYPFAHFYNEAAKRRPISMGNCLPANEENFVDNISTIILSEAGSWDEYNSEGVIWNVSAAKEALLYQVPPIRVQYGRVTREMIDLLGENWFKFASKGEEVDATLETRKKFREGNEIGMKEFMLLLWRNEASMSYSMEGRQLWEKKEEYYTVCRELIKMFLESGKWVNEYAKSYPIGYKYSMDERWKFMVNAVVSDALEFDTNNGVETKGSYAMFVLKLFAEELLDNAKQNRVDKARFFSISIDIESLLLDIDLERAKETEELFEKVPVKVEPEVPECPVVDEPPIDMEWLEQNCPPIDDYEFVNEYGIPV